MKDIKFRAWDKENKEWISDTDSFFNGMFFNRKIGSVGIDFWSTKFELMQYTGLKDKNGKEIFEGDIVKEEQYMSNDLISEVRFYEGRFDSLVRVKEGYNCIDQYSPESFEVIGNIHEHSHLLGVTKQP